MNEDALIIHADNYCQESITEFYRAHLNRPKKCLMTMMTFRCKDPSICGIVEINSSNIVEKFHEKTLNPHGNLANCAIYIISPEMQKLLRENFSNAKEFTVDVIDKFTKRIYTYEAKKLFIDIGTHEAYMMVNS
jgi:mannose-1-phosphate guanylyltransferase